MKAWELHIFPSGKVGERKTRFGVWVWIWLNRFQGRELRAINRETGEHIVAW